MSQSRERQKRANWRHRAGCWEVRSRPRAPFNGLAELVG
jgi:hypothetical protein